jgi:hypothetical protein
MTNRKYTNRRYLDARHTRTDVNVHATPTKSAQAD